MDTQFKKGVMELCVLSILKQKDYYGYELVQKISKDIEISEGTLYPILRRLEKEDYLKKYFQETLLNTPRKDWSPLHSDPHLILQKDLGSVWGRLT